MGAVCEVLEVLWNSVMVEERCGADLLGEVDLLRSELDLLKNLLLSSEDSTNNSIREFNRRARDLVYEVEDAIDSYVTATVLERKRGGGFPWPWRGYGEGNFRKNIRDSNRRISVLNHLLGAGRDSAKGDRSGGGEITVQVPEINLSSDPVGMEGDAECLTQFLLGGQPKLDVVSICGMGGLGKTTLAKAVYRDPLVVNHFDSRIWVHVGQDFQPRQILETVLFSLDSVWSKKEIAAMETMEMLDKLYKAQTKRRYLIVLDDVWSSENLGNLLVGFPPGDSKGSRIVVTTRSCSTHSSTESVLHMHLLPDEISWEVLKLRSQLVDDPEMQVNQEMEKVGRQIGKLCAGLPLALTVIGRALRTKRNLNEWKKVLLLLSRYQKPEPPMPNWLDLSYSQLPSRLKPCFLYLGVFPPNQPIRVRSLYSLWIAEGFISASGLKAKTAIEVAEEYLQELVDRCLVVVVEKKKVSASRKFKSCKLHDLMHLLCIWKSKEEEFCEVVSGNRNKIRTSTRRLSVWRNSTDFLFNIPESKRIRSILFFDTNESLPKTHPEEFSDLKKSQRTRVLNFDGVDFRVKKMPKGIQKLIYLRHLSFQGCYLQELPSSVSNFPLLETLDLRVIHSCVMIIANVLRKISSLRHLFLPLAFRVDKKEKLKLDTLINLEILENFNAGLCDSEDLLQLENLHILKVSVDGDTMDLKNVISCMKRNRFLRHSSLVVKKFDAYSKERLFQVAALLDCNALHGLNIEGHLGVVPRHQGISSNFTSMVFDGSEFTEDPMPILGKFPNLRRLVLCNDAFLGKQMVCSESDFLRLESLKLATLQHLEKLEIEGAMPNLIVITIDQCDKLVRLPYGLSEITTLRKFMIGSMPIEFQEIVNEMIKERKDLGNQEVAVTFYDF